MRMRAAAGGVIVDDRFELDAYLRRIGYDGPPEPSLPALRAIIAAHSAAIPFENIDVLLKRGVSLDIAAIQRKLVQQRRGGYCFEQNTLLEAALRALGFSLVTLVARVVRGLPDSAQTARAHQLLQVDLPEGAYIADVGYGNLTPTGPLALRLSEEQPTPNETFRLIPHGNEFVLQARFGDVWDSLYRFGLQPTPPIDYEMGNWFTSTWPRSLFYANLIVARASPGRRATLFNRRLAIRDRDGSVARRVLAGIDDYREALAEHFGLSLDDDELVDVTAAMASRPPDEEVPRAFI
jgi:N-hydroxyarylamine O-acetyltransferase